MKISHPVSIGPVSIGMVGGGYGSNVGNTHRDAMRLDGLFELKAGVFSAEPARGRSFGASIGIAPDRCYPTVDDMLTGEAARADGIRAVTVVVPNHLHAEVVRSSLSRGVHVLCEKPLTTRLADAVELRDLAAEHRTVLALAHGYSGYAMVHAARDLIDQGTIGSVVEVQAEYVSAWGAKLADGSGLPSLGWKLDPAKAGQSIVVSDLGTHAHHLARLVTGLEVVAVSAELSTLVPGREVDDNAHVLLRFDNGARGMLWTTMAAAGAANNLRVRVYGGIGHLEWTQDSPDLLTVRPLDGPVMVHRRSLDDTPLSAQLSRRRPGQAEGLVEAFANIYRAAYPDISGVGVDMGRDTKSSRHPAYPDGNDGVTGVAFVEAVVQSSSLEGRWVRVGRGRHDRATC